ncbi:MAG: hypothetical protein GY814_04070 [Gammaproteobacteria bacterium]|nr:hypothetical protein [Gammaproteobacteria bacterium]
MSKRTQTQAILDQVNQEVAGLGNAERRRVLLALRQAEEELAVALAEWLKRKPDGAGRFTAKHYRQALAQIRGTRAVFDTVGTTLNDTLNAAGKTATVMSYEHIRQQWEHFSLSFDGEIKQLPITIAGRLATVQNSLLHRYRKISSKYTRETRKWVTKQLAVGVIKGETFDQMTSRLVKLAGPKGLISNAPLPDQMARGVLSFPRSRVSRIVRTEVINAYNKGHMESVAELAKDDDAVMKRWDSTLDRRGCATCRDLDGEIRKPLDTFSTEVQHPPQHPHCRCTVVAWKKNWAHPSLPSAKQLSPVISPVKTPA